MISNNNSIDTRDPLHCIDSVNMIFTKFHISIRLEDLMAQSQLCFLSAPPTSFGTARQNAGSLQSPSPHHSPQLIMFLSKTGPSQFAAWRRPLKWPVVRKQDLLGPSWQCQWREKQVKIKPVGRYNCKKIAKALDKNILNYMITLNCYHVFGLSIVLKSIRIRWKQKNDE